MFNLKAQYFLTFAVMGSLLPFLPVYLKQHGLGSVQIGYIGSAASAAVLITPVLATLLADGTISGRRLLAFIFGICGAVLWLMYRAEGFWAILLFFSLYNLAFAASTSLQDGLNFLVQGRRRSDGLPTVDYHRIRVWGTVGFIVPSVLLFVSLRHGYPIRLIMLFAIGFCVLGLFNAFGLPRVLISPEKGLGPTDPEAFAPTRDARRLPTLEAAKAMLDPRVLVFCLAMFLAHMATAAYYFFYPIYLKESVGLDEQWLGVVSSIGVGIEIFYMLGFGRLMSSWGIKRLMAVGVGCMAVRFALLGASNSIWVAVGTQVLHGMMVLVVHVAPPIFINRYAQDRYRNSMQGLYVMIVYGLGRIVGNFVAGHIAETGVQRVFLCGAVLCVLAAGLFIFAFHEKPHGQAGQA